MGAEVVMGDNLEVMRTMPDCSIDAVIMDPPAGISFMNMAFDSDKGGRDAWVAWLTGVMSECLRVAKPGAHALVWALPRTSGWTHRALEDAGWDVRDCITHLFGSGFPKSHNLPGGLGTALKPGAEFWYLARKPLIGTVAANVEQHGTGALNIDGCRIEGTPRTTHADGNRQGTHPAPMDWGESTAYRAEGAAGRWPANVALDEAAAEMLDAQSEHKMHGTGSKRAARREADATGMFALPGDGQRYGDTGGASRFFYCAKASRSERNAGLEGMPERFLATMGAGIGAREHNESEPSAWSKNHHPTVKPISLMRWLCRLITPRGGLILDPFTGSGSTGCAAVLEGFDFVGAEMDPEYVEIARRRIAYWEREARKAQDLGPLFAMVAD